MLPAFYRFAPLVTFILVSVVNFLPFGERRFEDDADTLVNAANYAFSIWGVIFIGLIGFSVVLANLQINEAKAKEKDTPYLRKAILGLCIAGLASIAFVPISIGGNQLFGFLDVAAHLLALIYAYSNLRAHIKTTPDRPRKQGFWFYGPSMYLGWISAATVIAASLALDQLGFAPGQQISEILAAVLIVILLGIGFKFLLESDAIYSNTVAWALVGVGVEQAAVPMLQYLAWAAAAILVAAWIIRLVQGKFCFYASPGAINNR